MPVNKQRKLVIVKFVNLVNKKNLSKNIDQVRDENEMRVGNKLNKNNLSKNALL